MQILLVANNIFILLKKKSDDFLDCTVTHEKPRGFNGLCGLEVENKNQTYYKIDNILLMKMLEKGVFKITFSFIIIESFGQDWLD